MITFSISDNILICNGETFTISEGDYPTWEGLVRLGINRIEESGIEWLVFPGIVEEGTTLSNNYFFHNIEIGQSSCRSYMYEYINNNIDILVGSNHGNLVNFTTLDGNDTEVKFVQTSLNKLVYSKETYNILQLTNENFPILSSLYNQYNITYTIEKLNGCYYVIQEDDKLYGYDVISPVKWMNPFRYSLNLSNMLIVNDYITNYQLDEKIKVKGQQIYPTIFDVSKETLLQQNYTGWVTISSFAALLNPANILQSNNNSILINSDIFAIMCGRNFFNCHSKYTVESIEANTLTEVINKYPSDYLDNLKTTHYLFTPNYNDDYLVLLTSNKYHYVSIDSNSGILLCSADSTVYKANLKLGINYLNDYMFMVNEYNTDMIYADVTSVSSYYQSISSNTVSVVGLAWSDSSNPVTVTINESNIIFTGNTDININLSNPSNLSISSTDPTTIILKAVQIRKES